LIQSVEAIIGTDFAISVREDNLEKNERMGKVRKMPKTQTTIKIAAIGICMFLMSGSLLMAGSVSYNLGCVVSSNTCGGYANVGTWTYSDNQSNSKQVNIQISFTSDSWKLLQIGFNYDDRKFPLEHSDNEKYVWRMSTGISVAENGSSIPGFGSYNHVWDMASPASGNLGATGLQTTPFVATISLVKQVYRITGYTYKDHERKAVYGWVDEGYYDLNPEDFNFLTDGCNDPKLHVGVHIGNYSNGQSIGIGDAEAPQRSTSVPEPASLSLLASGILALAAISFMKR
jgi:hypothetical protein